MSGGLFGVGVEGTSLSARERAILAAEPPLGVILFARNIEAAGQVEGLIREVRGLGVKLLFLDQEGGPVDRLRSVLGPSPSFRRAARGNGARRAGELAGEALARLGFDVDLAPVVDRGLEGAGALVLGDRAASTDAGEIIAAAGEFLDGLHSRGIAGCLKHFPGLGRARVDTHEALPVLDDDAPALALDLAPFEALMGQARAVMVSHASADSGTPASLAREWATVRLREVLGFEGAAFSDDLEMGALSAFGGLPDRCVAAALAGCDLLFLCRRLEEYPACVEAVRGRVPAPRRSEAAERLEGYVEHVASLRYAGRGGRDSRSISEIAATIRELDASLPA